MRKQTEHVKQLERMYTKEECQNKGSRLLGEVSSIWFILIFIRTSAPEGAILLYL